MSDSHVVLYRASDRLEANLLAEALEGEGIEVELAGGDSPMSFGELGSAEVHATELWVQRENLERGHKLIVQLQSKTRSSSNTGPWQCPRCGEGNDANFEACWSCQTGRSGE